VSIRFQSGYSIYHTLLHRDTRECLNRSINCTCWWYWQRSRSCSSPRSAPAD